MSSTAEFEEVQQREACRDARRRSAARLDLPGPIWKEFRSLAVVSLHTPSTVTQIRGNIHASLLPSPTSARFCVRPATASKPTFGHPRHRVGSPWCC